MTKTDKEILTHNQRTLQQNKSLWLFFTMLAQELNDSGWDMKRTLKQEVDIKWTPESVKTYLWAGIQEAMYGTTSTTELTTKQIDEVYDVLNKHLGEKTGVSVVFPSKEEV